MGQSFAMDDATKAKIEVLVKKRRQLDKNMKVKQEEFDALWKQTRIDALEVETELAILCEHTWKRDNYLYAELYCSTCFIEQRRWKRLDNERKKVSP
jgi:hypothetical protein